MGRLDLANVCRKSNGRLYYRRKVNGKDSYIRLPAIEDPGFAEAYARASADGQGSRRKPTVGTIGHYVREYRCTAHFKALSETTRRNRLLYLGMLEEMDGHRTIAGCTRPAVRRMRDRFSDTPGKANNFLTTLRLVLEMAIEDGLIRENPARGIAPLPLGEHEPWPVDVLERALAAATPMLRLAIITGLCSGARISDVIQMQHGWHDGSIMRFRTKKRVGARRKGIDVAVPMHPLWLAEIGKCPRKSVTILYDRTGKPFSDTDILQERVKRLMEEIGSPTYETNGRYRGYSFHGLRKNAACYLAELGLSDGEIGSICGMTPDTVRHYTKRARALMIAKGAADKVTGGDVLPLRAGHAPKGAK